MIYIFWSCRNKEEAKKVVLQLIDLRLIACSSIFPEVTSIYRWGGKIEESLEVKVILKTGSENFTRIEKVILTNCSYEVPEIAMVKIEKCNEHYFSWLKNCL